MTEVTNSVTNQKEYIPTTLLDGLDVVEKYDSEHQKSNRSNETPKLLSDDKDLSFDIEVDGGVKANWTIAECAEAGANCFIAGSGMFKYEDLSVGCAELRRIAVAAQKDVVLPKGEIPPLRSYSLIMLV